MSVAIAERGEIDARQYRGMNPDFVRRVWAERRRKEVKPVEQVPRKTNRQLMAERSAEFASRIDDRRVKKLKLQIEAGGVKGIIAEVALAHCVGYEDILGRSRFTPIVNARHAAVIEVAIRRPAMSLPQIAKFFKRDHTTILHVLHKHQVPGRISDKGAER